MKYSILALSCLTLLMSSCQREIDSTTIEIELPDTETLLTSNISGEIKNDEGLLLSDITVDLLVGGNVLASTQTVDGLYRFQDQAAHQTKTIIRAHSKEYAPNFINISVEAGTNNLDENLTIQALDFINSFEAQTEINQEFSPNFSVEIPEGSFESSTTMVEITAKQFVFSSGSSDLMGIRTGIDIDNNEILLNFNTLYHIGAYALASDDVILKAQTEFSLRTPLHPNLELWAFDIFRGKWVPYNDFEIENDQNKITTEDFTYFAFVNGACDMDIEAPVALCSDENVIIYSQVQTIYATDFDLGSYDNCTLDLDFKIKALTDLCQNGSDEYADSLPLCNAVFDLLDYPMRLLVEDESGNQDSCDFTIDFLLIDCNNDLTPPMIDMVDDLTVVLRGNGIYNLKAETLDIASTDDCSSELIFQIRKLSDDCSNQSHQYRDFVEFCSAEVGNTVVVNVEVIDENFNVSNKNINVIVEAPDCSSDTEGPLGSCCSRELSLTNGFLELDANFMDCGSTDNCSPQLTFQIKKDIDLCQNGSDTYGNSITFCPEEMGMGMFITMRISDDNGNARVCGISHFVSSEDCINDTKKPILIVKELYVHRLSYGTTLLAEALDLGSIDSCSDNLSWSIRKTSDSCGNGSNIPGPSITFCTDEIGTTVEAEITIMDASNNSQSKLVSIMVFE